jgi:hypothetical protein
MGYVSGDGARRGRWTAALRRAAAAPYVPAIAGALLAVAAAAQAFVLFKSSAALDAANQQVTFLLLALATTLPLGLLWQRWLCARRACCPFWPFTRCPPRAWPPC